MHGFMRRFTRQIQIHFEIFLFLNQAVLSHYDLILLCRSRMTRGSVILTRIEWNKNMKAEVSTVPTILTDIPYTTHQSRPQV